MNTRKKAAAKDARRAIADVAGQLAALHGMTVAQLRDRYREVFGAPTTSRHKDALRKKIAWRIQELAEGGLSDRAKARIEELAAESPVRWRGDRGNGKPVSPPDTKTAPRERDPRLPAPGTVLTRHFQGQEHRITVLEDGFEYQGATHRSLSKIAREITGTNWNGLLFFGLQHRSRRRDGEAA